MNSDFSLNIYRKDNVPSHSYVFCIRPDVNAECYKGKQVYHLFFQNNQKTLMVI